MGVVLCAVDPAGGRLILLGKTGPSSYGFAGQIDCGNGSTSVLPTEPGRALVAARLSNRVGIVDLRLGRRIGEIVVGWAPCSLAAVPGTAYVLVCNAGSDAVSVIDTRTARETQRIAVGREPRHVVTAEDGLSAYVSEQGAGTVCRLDLTALHENGSGAVELVWRSMLGRHVQPCLVVPTGGGTAVVLTRRGPRLPLLDLTSGLMLASVALPAAAAVSAGGAVGAVSVGEGFLLVAVERPGLIAVVDLLECTVSRTITLGARPRDITIDPADQTVYCALPWSGRVAVVHLDGVDLSTEDGRPQFESIAAGRAPCSVAVLADSDFDET